MTYRKPLPSDIGKSVEFSIDGEQWHTAKLSSIDYDETGPLFWQNIDGKHRFFNHCRVPYSCPDPIAELSEAADLLAERGADEAARVLMAEIERLQKTQEDSEQYGGFLISQLPVDLVKTRHDGWFYVHDTESDYLRKDGRFHGTCGDEGFYETREEARQAIDDYNQVTNPEPQT